MGQKRETRERRISGEQKVYKREKREEREDEKSNRRESAITGA